MMLHRALFALTLSLGLFAGSADWFRTWVDSADLPSLIIETSVEVRDQDGQLLRPYMVSGGRWRLDTPPNKVDSRYLRMLIGFEDQRFYDHAGVDPKALLRALVQAVRAGRIVSGGSTLTMQTARLLERGTTGQLKGKLRQIRLALALEKRLSKEEILALYLNLAPMGGNVEGIRAATLAYFGKEPWRLTPAEAALLVALPQSPESRRPDRHAAAAEQGRNRVLMRMVSKGILSRADADAAMRDPVPADRATFPRWAPHLADFVKRQKPLADRHVLTIRRDLQQKLESLASNALLHLGAEMSVAVMVADHHSGAVLASVGSAGYQGDKRHGFVDMTRAVRSPGSTLKPLIYGLGFDHGLIHPETLIEDRPTVFGTYQPQNFDRRFRGTVRIREALEQSLNIPVVSILQELGPAKLITAMKRSGANPKLTVARAGLAIGLGGIGVTLEDLIRIYGTLARQGSAMPLHWERGAAGSDTPKRVMAPEAAWQVGHILSGIAPPPNAPPLALAYKTGTSYGHRDAWAVGYDGTHVAAVWMGRPDGTPVPGVFGGELAAPVLFDIFAQLGDQPMPLGPPPPATLLVANTDLPLPLQRFENRKAAFRKDVDAPKIMFPPKDAVMMTENAMLVARLRDGAAPFTWLANGTPVLIGSHDRQVELQGLGKGHIDLAVIDAKGRAARTSIFLN